MDGEGIGTLLNSNGAGFASRSTFGVDTSGGSVSCNSNIAGGIGLTKLGGNTLVLAGSNTYAGATTVNQGNLTVNGSIAGAVIVRSGGSLSGTGSLTAQRSPAAGKLPRAICRAS